MSRCNTSDGVFVLVLGYSGLKLRLRFRPLPSHVWHEYSLIDHVSRRGRDAGVWHGGATPCAGFKVMFKRLQQNKISFILFPSFLSNFDSPMVFLLAICLRTVYVETLTRVCNARQTKL